MRLYSSTQMDSWSCTNTKSKWQDVWRAKVVSIFKKISPLNKHPPLPRKKRFRQAVKSRWSSIQHIQTLDTELKHTVQSTYKHCCLFLLPLTLSIQNDLWRFSILIMAFKVVRDP
jgi:hypothetical protein